MHEGRGCGGVRSVELLHVRDHSLGFLLVGREPREGGAELLQGIDLGRHRDERMGLGGEVVVLHDAYLYGHRRRANHEDAAEHESGIGHAMSAACCAPYRYSDLLPKYAPEG